jgi:hypothetical protein
MGEKTLSELKKDYLEIQEKYSLPDFQEFNQNFQIEKIAEYETDILIREVRKFVAEKLSNYMKFIEMIINPLNAPMSIFSLIKSLGQSDKKKLSEIYEKLVKNEIEIVELDLNFSEEKEVEYIKNSYNLWKEIKKDLLEIIETIKKNWDNDSKKGEAGYFG